MSPPDGEGPALDTEHRARVCRHHFEIFARAAFAALYPGKTLQWAPYLSLLCARLQDLVDGEGRNLIVTLPPRGLKSFLVSVAFPAFVLGHNASRQIMTVSYAQSLSEVHGRDRIKLLRSSFYRSVFGDVLTPAGSARRVTTEEHGGIFATGIDGSATGMGADYLIFDDPQNAQDALSEQVRTSSNQQFEQTFLSRRNDPLTARIIIVMQRLHEEDFVGHALGIAGLDWDLVNLPAIAEDDEVHVYRGPGGERTFRRRPGDPLHASRFPADYLESMRETLGEARFATQYQQRPAPAGGGLVQEKWFKRYTREDLPAQFEEIIQSWDTANKVSEWADWTVCTTWGRIGTSVYLIHVHRERLLFPDLVRAVRRLAERFNPTVVLVEDHASGTQLVQVLREDGFGKCRAIKPVGDKEIRMTNQTALIESGRVWIPSDADWVQAYLRELVVFPNAKYDDQVDSTSQALAYLGSWLESRGVFEFTRQRVLKANPPPSFDRVFWLMKPPAPNIALQGTLIEYRAGPNGTVWIPEYEATTAFALGWAKIDEFIPEPVTLFPKIA